MKFVTIILFSILIAFGGSEVCAANVRRFLTIAEAQAVCGGNHSLVIYPCVRGCESSSECYRVASRNRHVFTDFQSFQHFWEVERTPTLHTQYCNGFWVNWEEEPAAVAPSAEQAAVSGGSSFGAEVGSNFVSSFASGLASGFSGSFQFGGGGGYVQLCNNSGVPIYYEAPQQQLPEVTTIVEVNNYNENTNTNVNNNKLVLRGGNQGGYDPTDPNCPDPLIGANNGKGGYIFPGINQNQEDPNGDRAMVKFSASRREFAKLERVAKKPKPYTNPGIIPASEKKAAIAPSLISRQDRETQIGPLPDSTLARSKAAKNTGFVAEATSPQVIAALATKTPKNKGLVAKAPKTEVLSSPVMPLETTPAPSLEVARRQESPKNKGLVAKAPKPEVLAALTPHAPTESLTQSPDRVRPRKEFAGSPIANDTVNLLADRQPGDKVKKNKGLVAAKASKSEVPTALTLQTPTENLTPSIERVRPRKEFAVSPIAPPKQERRIAQVAPPKVDPVPVRELNHPRRTMERAPSQQLQVRQSRPKMSALPPRLNRAPVVRQPRPPKMSAQPRAFKPMGQRPEGRRPGKVKKNN